MPRMGRPPKENGPKRYINAAFEPDEIKTLRALSRKEGMTMSALIRHLALVGLKKGGVRHAP